MSKNKKFKLEVNVFEKSNLLKLLKSFGTTMSVHSQKNVNDEYYIFFSVRNITELNQIKNELAKKGKEIEAII